MLPGALAPGLQVWEDAAGGLIGKAWDGQVGREATIISGPLVSWSRAAGVVGGPSTTWWAVMSM